MAKKLFCVISFILISTLFAHAQKHAIDFKGVTTDKSEFHLNTTLKDKYVLLNFTSNDCGYCWRIYPYLIKLQEEYKDQLVIICVHNMDSDTYENWEKSAKQFYRDNAQKIIDNELLTIWKASYLCNDYSDPSKNGWPHFFLINRDGEIVKKWFGANEKKLITNLEKELKR
ncbi:MAG: TlpA disulfide reductase family protein [Rikenellaceae bacterium]